MFKIANTINEVSQKRYCGKERDEEIASDSRRLLKNNRKPEQSGLYYYGARYYAAWLGRFVSVDPRKDEYPMWSSYVYAGNMPVTLTDVNGEGPGDGGTPQQFDETTVDGISYIYNDVIWIKMYDVTPKEESQGSIKSPSTPISEWKTSDHDKVKWKNGQIYLVHNKVWVANQTSDGTAEPVDNYFFHDGVKWKPFTPVQPHMAKDIGQVLYIVPNIIYDNSQFKAEVIIEIGKGSSDINRLFGYELNLIGGLKKTRSAEILKIDEIEAITSFINGKINLSALDPHNFSQLKFTIEYKKSQKLTSYGYKYNVDIKNKELGGEFFGPYGVFGSSVGYNYKHKNEGGGLEVKSNLSFLDFSKTSVNPLHAYREKAPKVFYNLKIGFDLDMLKMGKEFSK